MKKIILSSIIFALAFSCFAQKDPKFTVEVSNDSILLGNSFEVTFTLENAEGANFQMPGFSDFTLVGGPNQSSNFSMVNGDVTQTMSYSFFLEPKDIGNFYVEPANIEIEDSILETQPIEIITVPNPDGIVQRPKKRGQEWGDDFFGRSFEFQTPPTPKPPATQKKKKNKKRKTYKL